MITKLKRFFQRKKVDSLQAEMYLMPVKMDEQFKIYGGGSIGNLDGLFFSLLSMENNQFLHHMANGRNDFSMWVKLSIGDKDLAQKMMMLKSKEELAIVVGERLKELHLCC